MSYEVCKNSPWEHETFLLPNTGSDLIERAPTPKTNLERKNLSNSISNLTYNQYLNKNLPPNPTDRSKILELKISRPSPREKSHNNLAPQRSSSQNPISRLSASFKHQQTTSKFNIRDSNSISSKHVIKNLSSNLNHNSVSSRVKSINDKNKNNNHNDHDNNNNKTNSIRSNHHPMLNRSKTVVVRKTQSKNENYYDNPQKVNKNEHLADKAQEDVMNVMNYQSEALKSTFSKLAVRVGVTHFSCKLT